MEVWTLMIQRNSMIPRYSMIQRDLDFDNPKVHGDTSIFVGLVLNAVHFEILPVSGEFFTATISWKVFEYSDELHIY